MDILWPPEEGGCACCRRVRTTVRGFSYDGLTGLGVSGYVVMCFACWNRMQIGTIVSSQEWVEKEAIVFTDQVPEFENETPSSITPH